MASNYCVALDLGQARDYTALAILEQLPGPVKAERAHYHLRHLERLALGTTYPNIVKQVRKLYQKREFGKLRPLLENAPLVVDVTGCGKPVFDMFVEENLYPVGIYIHGGDAVSCSENIFRVPKRDLVSVLQLLFQSERLKIAKQLPEAKTLIDELLNFRVKIDTRTAHDSYEAWREGQHDDLVLAVAMAAWYAERYLSTSESVGFLPGQHRGDGLFDFETEAERDEGEDMGGNEPGFF